MASIEHPASVGLAQEDSKQSLLPRLSVLILSLLVATFLCDPIYQAEALGQLVRGRWIVSNGLIPRFELWTISALQRPIVETGVPFLVIQSLLWLKVGPWAVGLFKLGCYLLIISSLGFSCVSQAKDRFVGYALAFFASIGVLATSPSGVALIAFASYPVLLTTQRRLPFLLAAWILALHSPYWPILLALAFLWNQRNYLLVIGALVISLFTPYFGSETIWGLKIFQLGLNSVADWQSYLIEYSYQLAIGLILIGLFVAVSRQQRRWDRRLILLLLGALFLSLVNGALLPYFVIIAALSCSRLLSLGSDTEISQALAQLKRRLIWLYQPPAEGKQPLILGVLWLALCFALVFAKPMLQTPLALAHYPYFEVREVLKHRDLAPIYHDYKIGGFVSFMAADERGEGWLLPVLDDRSPLILPEQYDTSGGVDPNLDEIFKFNSVICDSKSQLCKNLQQQGEGWSEYRIEEAGRRQGYWKLFTRRH